MEIIKIAFFFLLFLFFLLHVLRRRQLRHSTPPSPLSLPLLGHLLVLQKPLHRSLATLSTIHGPILSLRFGSRPVLLISSASAAQACFSKNDAAFGNRPRFLAGKHLGYNYTTLTWSPCGPHWSNLRRIIALDMLSAACLDSFSTIISQEVSAMVDAVASAATGSTKAVDIRARLFELNLNVIMQIVAGKRLTKQAEEVRQIVRQTFELSGATNLADFIPALRLFDYKGLEKKLIGVQGRRDSVVQKLVDERREMLELHAEVVNGESEGKERSRKCLIDELLALQSGNPEQYNDEIIKGLVVTMMSTGTDTSALTTEWALAELLSNPTALSKVRAEIDQHVGRARLINRFDLQNLTYLRSVIRETMRLHPPAALIPAHESSVDCSVEGFRVPRGVMLLVNAWAIQRDPALWKEAEAFRPERWEEEEGDELACRKQGKALFFGMGRRGCPGEGLALRMVALALGSLVQCFEWDGEASGAAVDLAEGAGLNMPMATPLQAICKKRNFAMFE